MRTIAKRPLFFWYTQEIPQQAYGGVEYIKQWDPNQNREVARTVFKQYSAYMLFYEVCRKVSGCLAIFGHTTIVLLSVYASLGNTFKLVFESPP